MVHCKKGICKKTTPLRFIILVRSVSRVLSESSTDHELVKKRVLRQEEIISHQPESIREIPEGDDAS